ncbi:TatD family hydrolase [Bacillus sp. A116_S68]|jgi:TatD DNase family protein|nr:TatD family hydrolase [Bacillus sp. A116_S68]
MTLIDTHVHLDFYSKPHQIAEEYNNNQIYTLFMTNLPEVFNKQYEEFKRYKYVRISLGYHPQIASEYELDRSLFKSLVKKTRYIGEVGLDFKNEHHGVINKQIDNFEFITSKEFNQGRVYSVHSKNTEDVTLDILKNNSVKHCIFHWYTGKLSTIDKIVDEGYYFSLNPKLLFTKNGQNVIARIPRNRILFETDGPFVKINKKTIGPKDLKDIYNEFEKMIPDFEKIVFKNFKRLLIEKDLST